MNGNLLADNLNEQNNAIEDVIDNLAGNLWDADELNEAVEQVDEVIYFIFHISS